MSEKFLFAHDFTARWEGGVSDHPSDRGGLTAYGASIRFVQNIASTSQGAAFLDSIGVAMPVTRESMRHITAAQARQMFHYVFWQPMRLDDLPQRAATCIYDMAVNSGPTNSVRTAQKGYNRCVMHGTRLAADGILGPFTRHALQQDTDAIIRAILDEREDFFAAIVQRDPSQACFLRGWMNRLNGLRSLLGVR